MKKIFLILFVCSSYSLFAQDRSGCEESRRFVQLARLSGNGAIFKQMNTMSGRICGGQLPAGRVTYWPNNQLLTVGLGSNGLWYWPNGKTITVSARADWAIYYYPNGQTATVSGRNTGAMWYYPNGQTITVSAGRPGAIYYRRDGTYYGTNSPAMIDAQGKLDMVRFVTFIEQINGQNSGGTVQPPPRSSGSLIDMVKRKVPAFDIKERLRSGANVHEVDSEGNSLLMWSILKEYSFLPQDLIEFGAKLDHQNNKGETAVMHASYLALSTFGPLKTLVDAGASLNLQSKKGDTALFYALHNKLASNSVIEYLLKSGADSSLKNSDGLTVLHISLLRDFDSQTRALLSYGVDVNIPMTKSGFTPLIIALSKNKSWAVDMLLEREDIDLSLRDDNGQTALLYAVIKKDFLNFEKIYKAGASLYQTYKDFTIEEYAIHNFGEEKVIKMVEASLTGGQVSRVRFKSISQFLIEVQGEDGGLSFQTILGRSVDLPPGTYTFTFPETNYNPQTLTLVAGKYLIRPMMVWRTDGDVDPTDWGDVDF